jgi:hypothetical protein
VQYCALNETIASKSLVSSSQNTERDERDKKRLRDYDSLITFILENVTAEICHSIQSLVSSLDKVLTEKAANDSWDDISEQYEKNSHSLESLFQFESSFCQIVSLYV